MSSKPGQVAAITVDYSSLYRLTDRLYRAGSRDDVFTAALDAITEGLGCERASILLFDETGVMRFVAWRGLSDSYRQELEGHSPWQLGEKGPQAIFVTDIADTDQPQWIKARIQAESIRGLAFIPLCAQDEVIGKFMTYYREPHAFDHGEIELATAISRQVGFTLERQRAEQARRVAEEELRASEGQFRAMAEQAPVMIWTSDEHGRCVHLNSLLREFWGVREEDVSNFDWSTTIHPEDVDRIGQAMGVAVSNRASVCISGRYRNAAGEYRMLLTEARPQFSTVGFFKGMIGVNVDITERHHAEAQRELLIAELNHRVKNTLAVVQGISHQTFRGVGPLNEEKAAFEGRLMALSSAHNLLTETSWKSASLHEVCTEALQLRDPQRQRIKLSGPRVMLTPRAVLSLSLALHELLTNAIKYGALSNLEGVIEVKWIRTGEDQPVMVLSWVEIGGPLVSKPDRQGFGSRLLQNALTKELEATATIEFRPEGLEYRIEAPLSVLEEALP
jgi:PAS domain S-box-containing protein